MKEPVSPPDFSPEAALPESIAVSPFTALEIQEAIEQVGSTRIHDHFEGIFTAADLSTRGYDIPTPGIFERLGINLPDAIIESMHNTMAPAESKKDLSQFIGRLSTRWLRAGLMWGILHAEETGLTGEKILEEYFKSALEKMYLEGAVNVELMTALLNLTIEGDLAEVMTPPERMNPSSEEKDLIKQWNEQVQVWKANGVEKEHVPSIRTYLKTFKKVVMEDDRYCWEDEEKATQVQDPKKIYMPHGKQMHASPVIQIRRDQVNDCRVMNDDSLPYSDMNQAGRALMSEFIDCYYGIDSDGPLFGGFNIAGIEDMPNTELHRFTSFMQACAYHNIPLNVHAGEIRMNEWKTSDIPFAIRQGFNNLYIAIRNPNIYRLGHANLLPLNKKLMELFLEARKKIEACRTSNIWTSVATEEVQSVLDTAAELTLFLEHVLPQADDEAIFDQVHPYAQEVAFFAFKTGNAGKKDPIHLAEYLRDKGAEDLVWKKRRNFRPKKMFPHDEILGTVVLEVDNQDN